MNSLLANLNALNDPAKVEANRKAAEEAKKKQEEEKAKAEELRKQKEEEEKKKREEEKQRLAEAEAARRATSVPAPTGGLLGALAQAQQPRPAPVATPATGGLLGALSQAQQPRPTPVAAAPVASPTPATAPIPVASPTPVAASTPTMTSAPASGLLGALSGASTPKPATPATGLLGALSVAPSAPKPAVSETSSASGTSLNSAFLLLGTGHSLVRGNFPSSVDVDESDGSAYADDLNENCLICCRNGWVAHFNPAMGKDVCYFEAVLEDYERGSIAIGVVQNDSRDVTFGIPTYGLVLPDGLLKIPSGDSTGFFPQSLESGVKVGLGLACATGKFFVTVNNKFVSEILTAERSTKGKEIWFPALSIGGELSLYWNFSNKGGFDFSTVPDGFFLDSNSAAPTTGYSHLQPSNRWLGSSDNTIDAMELAKTAMEAWVPDFDYMRPDKPYYYAEIKITGLKVEENSIGEACPGIGIANTAYSLGKFSPGFYDVQSSAFISRTVRDLECNAYDHWQLGSATVPGRTVGVGMIPHSGLIFYTVDGVLANTPVQIPKDHQGCAYFVVVGQGRFSANWAGPFLFDVETIAEEWWKPQKDCPETVPGLPVPPSLDVIRYPPQDIIPGLKNQTGLPERNLPSQKNTKQWTSYHEGNAGKIVFSDSELDFFTQDNSILKTSFNSDQKIFGRAYWPTAIYNLPFAKTEPGHPVYGPQRLTGAFDLEFGLVFKIDGVAKTGFDCPEEGFWTIETWQRGFNLSNGWRGVDKDAENDVDNFYMFSHSLPIPVAGVNKIDNWGIANYYFNNVFYPMPKKAYQIDIEVKFRLVPTRDHNPQKDFPAAKTEWSHALASGSFNVNVDKLIPLDPFRTCHEPNLLLSSEDIEAYTQVLKTALNGKYSDNTKLLDVWIVGDWSKFTANDHPIEHHRTKTWGLPIKRINYVDPSKSSSEEAKECITEIWNTVFVPFTENKPSLLTQQIVQITFNSFDKRIVIDPELLTPDVRARFVSEEERCPKGKRKPVNKADLF